MNILITGGAGFVGSSIAIKLKTLYPSYSIIAFDNLKRRGSELNLTAFKELEIEFIHGDIRNQEDFENIKEIDICIEAFAEPSVLAGLESNPNYVINNNLVGSIHCFNFCIKQNARLIFLSTSRVYPIDRIENAKFIEEETRFTLDKHQNEQGISELGISEDLSLIGSRSFYGTTKLTSELFIQEYQQFYNLNASIIRYGVIAGPRQMGKTDQGIATLWLAKHFWKGSLQYIGYGGLGKQVRDMLHIDDLIDLIELQIHKPDLFRNKIFNAGGGIENAVSLKELTDICEEVTGNKIEIKSNPLNRPADLRIYITDNSFIKNEINWMPKKSIHQLFEDLFHWLRENEKELKPILS